VLEKDLTKPMNFCVPFRGLALVFWSSNGVLGVLIVWSCSILSCFRYFVASTNRAEPKLKSFSAAECNRSTFVVVQYSKEIDY
jgi:hypothetical protein